MKQFSVLLAAAVLLISACGCSPGDDSGKQPREIAKSGGKSDADQNANQQNIVDINITGLSFKAPDKILSGWTTFRIHNNSGMVHFALVEKFPEGYGVAEQQKEIAPLFQQ